MELEQELTKTLGKNISEADNKELYLALLKAVQDRAAALPTIQGKKKVYYISAEFLIGRQLGKNLINLGIYDEVANLLKANGKDIEEVEDEEAEPSLGNGGLGRLAACYLDSIATLNLPGDGMGLNYHFGLFHQQFRDHKQYEVPDKWLDTPGMLRKTDTSFTVSLAGKDYQSTMYDIDVIGYHGNKNTLHLFDLPTVDASIIKDGINFDKKDIARNLTLFLYPDDSDHDGKLLRIYQQYFMVSNSAQYILKEQKELGHDVRKLDQYVAIQINDTHPSMVIPELIRLLIKEGLTLREAADVVANTCAYTNHTILAEALEKWPLEDLSAVVPQLMPIIGGLDYAVVSAYHDDDSLNLIDRNHMVHMAKMDMHYSHSINGVANLHTEILKKQELRNFFNIYPDKFNNKTNGITFRRFIMHSNPILANYLDETITNEWRTDAPQLERMMYFYNDQGVLNKLEEIKHQNKVRLANAIQKWEGITIDPDSVYCIQVKRIHEYKRQQMNALWCIWKYQQIKSGNKPARPVTVIFGGKAAPAYTMAQDIIHLILCLQDLVNNDPDVSPWLKIVMLQNYDISKAEIVVPAADISEQISLASKEASGTGNMKFMLNGAVTLGTNDGANVEIRDLVGRENIYTFGQSSDYVINLYNTNGYHSIDYYNNSNSVHNCVDFITSPELTSIGDAQLLKDVQDNLKYKDWFMTLLDLESYTHAKESALWDYENREKWKRMSLVQIARAGFFSSDRAIREYNRDIWHLEEGK